MHHKSTLLDGTRTKIQRGWTKHAEVASGDVCLLGGLGEVLRSRDFSTRHTYDFNSLWRNGNVHDDLADAVHLISRAIRRHFFRRWLLCWVLAFFGATALYGYCTKRTRIAIFNDVSQTLKRDVIKVLDKAIVYALKDEKKETQRALKKARTDEIITRPEDKEEVKLPLHVV